MSKSLVMSKTSASETSVKNYYEKEADDYNRQFYVEDSDYPTLKYRHNYILEMVGQLDLPADAKILDIGCGPGEMVIDLMKDEREIWGIDIAENMVTIAEDKVGKALGKDHPRVHLGTGNIEDLDEFRENQFDLVIASGVVEYLHTDEHWTREMFRVIRPGGFLILNVTNKHGIRRWTAPVIEFFKSSKLIFNIGNFIKEKVLGRGKLHYFPFRPRVHSPKKFDQYLSNHGFQKVSHNYFDFTVLPAPLDTLFGFITVPIRKKMEKNTKEDNTLTGMGYIVAARKRTTAGRA